MRGRAIEVTCASRDKLEETRQDIREGFRLAETFEVSKKGSPALCLSRTTSVEVFTGEGDLSSNLSSSAEEGLCVRGVSVCFYQ